VRAKEAINEWGKKFPNFCPKCNERMVYSSCELACQIISVKNRIVRFV